jgi:hypothetical protein
VFQAAMNYVAANHASNVIADRSRYYFFTLLAPQQHLLCGR